MRDDEEPLYVLLVDSDPESHARTRAVLDAMPDLRVQVEWARDYDDALVQARTVQHDLHLVVDPVDHRSALDWMREAQATRVLSPIILVGREHCEAVESEAVAAGAADYVALPGLDAAQLARVVRDALRRARWRSEISLGLAQYQALFASAPIPMWVYDVETLRFLAVNEAAIAHYGYSEAEFRQMTLLDIRPAEDRGQLREAARKLPSGLNRSGPWRHLRKDGSTIEVLISSDDIKFDNHAARFTVIYDVTLQLRAERLMRDTVRQLRQVLADVGDALLVVGTDSRVRFANAAASALWQVPADHLEGRTLPLQAGHERTETELTRADGSRRLLDVRCAQTTWAGEQAQVVTLRDVTEARETEERLRLLMRAIQSSRNGVVIADARLPDQPLIFTNPAYEEITGYTMAESIGRNCRFLQGDERDQPELDELRRALREGRDCEVVLRNYRKDGTLFWNQLALSPVRDAEGTVTHVIGILSDVTERRRHESELAYLASRDPVTGLPLYLALEEHIRSALAEALAQGGHVALYCIDIDRFNSINDTLGHAIGDQALRALAERLRACVGDHGRIARLAGDKFVAVVPISAGLPDPLAFGEHLRACVEPALRIAPYTLHLSCTVGMALFPEHASSIGSLLNAAEMAMNRGKRRGGNNVVGFTPELGDELRDRIALGSRLRDAIEHDELTLDYQPQVSGLDGRIVALEALVRWRSPDRGLIMPSRFIRVAEDSGLIVPLGRWVLEHACRQLRAWRDAGHDDIAVAVNVSAHQLLRESFADDVAGLLARYGLPPESLELELTESALMENVDRVLGTLGTLKALGVRLTLDDFGTGYSSLNYLRRLPIGKLKIDRSFLAEVSSGSRDAAIARAVIAMGHQLQMLVLAEGVENEDQLGYLRRNHCDQFQGNLLSEALPAEQVDRLLRQRYLRPALFEATRPDRVLLVVDDEENVLRSLVRLFRRDGYRVLTAGNADEALALLARNHVQVILSDQRMPGTSGTEFLGKVKDLYPDTVRLVLSGYTDLATVTEAINRGAIYRFLTKPWNEAELREHIREAFRKHDAASTATMS